MKLHPNPTSERLNIIIEGSIKGQGKITVSDVLGRTLTTINEIENQQLTIDLSDFAPGIYLVNYSDAEHFRSFKVEKK